MSNDANTDQALQALRLRIDSLDEKILELISDRARCAEEVARVKMATLAEGEVPVFYRCLLYTSPSPRDQRGSRMPSSA